MKIKQIEIYNFDELSNEAKEKAREWYRDGNEYPFLEYDIQEKAKELLEKAGFTDIQKMKVYYSLSYSQGDGVTIEFTADTPDKKNTITVKQRGYYMFEHVTVVESIEEGEFLPDESIDFEQNVIKPISKELERFGYKWIESENEDDNVDELIRINEYTFTKEGERMNA